MNFAETELRYTHPLIHKFVIPAYPLGHKWIAGIQTTWMF